MSIRDRLGEDVKQALKAGDRARTSALRMLRARIQEREVALRTERGVGYALTDDFEVGLNVSNLFDDEHIEAFGGDVIERRALASVTYRW